MRRRLNNKELRLAKKDAMDGGRRVEVWDDSCAGLFAFVSPRGTVTYYVKYRFRGSQRKYKLGTKLTADEARVEARRVLREVDKGGDPQRERAADRRALRMIDLLGTSDDEDPARGIYSGWFLSTYVRTAGKSVDGQRVSKTDHSIRTDRSFIHKHLRPRKALLRKRVDAVTTTDLKRIKEDVTAGTWRKLRNILRVCFRHCEEIGAIPPATNPAAAVAATRSRSVERYLTREERRQLEAALAEAERVGPRRRGGVSPHIVRALRLLSLTGMRLGEVLDMHWEHVNWAMGVVELPSSKTGPKRVPLTPQALSFLRREQSKTDGVGHVCSNELGCRITASNVQRAWRSIRTDAQLPSLRIHDLRHSWASDAVSAGVPLAVIGKVLGHRSPATTARYAHVHDKALLEGLAKTGAVIEAATGG